MMKWWGWGDPNITFPIQDKPNLWPWIKNKLAMKKETLVPPVARDQIVLKTPTVNREFCDSLHGFLKSDQISLDEDERLLHSYGKSYPDLFRVRKGQIDQAPDMVCLPESHEDVEQIVRAAHAHNVCVIPFGGGTNIVGAVNPLDPSSRMVVSLDLRRMNRVLSIDKYSMTATIQSGALGPKLEQDLQAQGYSLGHYPDSFEYSTLGGWLATRSAGMQSDAYGKIEDMVVALRLVTPSGTIVTRPTPASSAGPDLNQLVVGSEGVLGVITEATMRVHRAPAIKDYRGFLFKSFEDGVAAIHETLDSGFVPSLIRLQDSGETELAFQLKTPKRGLQALIQKPIKRYLKAKGYTAPCIMIIGFEGEPTPVAHTRTNTLKILRKHGAFPLGTGVGQTWSKDKYNVPYLRDLIMDYGCMADVAETAAVWSKILPTYHNTIRVMKEKFDRDGLPGYIGCHISHTYKTGACLYFTYAVQQRPGKELEHYYSHKKLVTDTFMKSGATLTHHHGVGYEHLEWMEEEISPTGMQALRAVKTSLDPKCIFNPGKLLSENGVPVTAPKMNARVDREPPDLTM